MRRRVDSYSSLEEHPNLAEILGVLAQLPHVADADLPRLAGAWHNTVYLADARARALQPDLPLVVEVLTTFEAVQSLFADDVEGRADYVTVDPRVTTVALKAIRDAIAGAYARPRLSRGEHQALLRAWREVFPVQQFDEPDLGPRTPDIKQLLAALPLLGTRCHDHDAAEVYERLAQTAWAMDAEMRERAREETWQAAVLTSRRRVWALLRRSVAEAMGRPCPTCRGLPPADGERQVLALCTDAACALLVADAVDETLTEVLTLPLQRLVPAPRAPEA